MKSGAELTMCALCERQVQKVTYHHLIPKQKGGKHTETVPLCQPCHTTLHVTFSNTELANRYNSIPVLQQAEPLQKYLGWIKTKRIEKISQKKKRR
ncbi:HNH endonuclease signature motif containing protein [Rhodocytophaga aerolata]|uniref:HNH endonuclease signature motif containing protein n=1 Tax=Rhodocytophaga aerolata TaxID=455078 RepID=A0ABT8R2V5_9BACT|nr:HNH endonuclease signature motif containing protein [Rhodocytophaga aerolata]MDO1445613.1 HNH endonuclease signature motif containing protein [Rhodocytophaga aerolata]